MKVNEALKITESFTRTSKMPGLSYSLPAWACKTGQKLAKIPGTPCYGCYAMKGNYTRYPAIKAAQYRRLDAIKLYNNFAGSSLTLAACSLPLDACSLALGPEASASAR